jgi:[NiFe] hydrogenase assembly HybE family chaperone
MTTELPDPSVRLEAAFRAVADRMVGLGFVNPALRVEAVGFEPWDGHWLGVLVTPWSINLMLTPREADAWLPVRPGDKQRYAFPAGTYDFIDAADPVAGEYRMCSLFSPALEFDDHAAAVLVAQLARAALFDAAHAEPAEQAPPGPLMQLKEQASEPMSKREFLRGRFLAAKSDVSGR